MIRTTPYLTRRAVTTTAAALAAFALPLATPAAAKPPSEADIKKIEKALPRRAPAKPKADRHILVFSRTKGFRHSSIETGVEAMKLLGKKTGAFTVTATEDPAIFEAESLKKFDAIVFLNTTGECMDTGDREAHERRKQALVDFVKGGKGLAGMHSATDTYKKWSEFNDMMGGAFDGHPWHETVGIKNLDPKHPINKCFHGDDFEVKDEIYQFRNGTAKPTERRMLLALDGKKTDIKKRGTKREDGFYPVSWCRNYGEGRTFYCSLGHREEIYWNPVVLEHYLAGIQFALGDLEADASPSETP